MVWFQTNCCVLPSILVRIHGFGEFPVQRRRKRNVQNKNISKHQNSVLPSFAKERMIRAEGFLNHSLQDSAQRRINHEAKFNFDKLFFAEEVSPCIVCSSFVNGERTWAEILFLFFICSIHFNPFTRLGLYYFIQNWSQQTIFLIYCFKIIIVLRLKMNPVNKDGTHLPISVGVHVSFWVEAVAWISPSGTADLSRAGLVGVVLRLLLCGSQGAQACAKGIGLQNEKEMWARLKHH